MRCARFLPLAAFAFVAACSDPATSPTAQVRPSTPHFAPGTGAHFQSATGSFSGANLQIDFRESGLGNSPAATVHIEATAAGFAEYACINGGGKHPKAANKEDVNGPVSSSGDFPIGKNGSAFGTVYLAPPPSTLVCPSGQQFVLASVSFSNVSISDLTNSVLGFAVDGGPTFTKVFLVLE